MTDLEKLKNWLQTYPGADALRGFQVDYTDRLPGGLGLFPSGLVEIGRREDITGNVTVHNQYNFGLYIVFPKSPGDDAGALINADWIMDFQRWVQAQSIRHLAPTFGNTDLRNETISAQNGALFESDDEGTAMYMVQLSATFKLFFEEENQWMT